MKPLTYNLIKKYRGQRYWKSRFFIERTKSEIEKDMGNNILDVEEYKRFNEVRHVGCVECGGKQVRTRYNGVEDWWELVCENCGLVHAVVGPGAYGFYPKQNEIYHRLKTKVRK